MKSKGQITSLTSLLILNRRMNIMRSFIFIFTLLFSVNALCQTPGSNGSIKFYDGQSFTIIGKFHSEKGYARFPVKYKNTLRKEVWDLGQDCAGVSIRFRTNSPEIIVRWTAENDYSMDHMASTGVKGIDLYAYVDGGWRYAATGRVKGKNNEYTLIKAGGNIYREYLLNLPLYDGVDSLSIGVKSDADISLPKERYLIDKKPVVYYGTSIAQGGCASRPGMAFTNILSRDLDRSFINMAFSGNGNCELSVGEAMCEVDAALYVIDCNPNTEAKDIYSRAIDLVKLLKQKRPDVPVLLVEGYYFENDFIEPKNSEPEKKRIELRHAYNDLKKSGIKDLYYKKGDGLIGYDHEGTVDGIHPNDLGMLRMAKALKPIIQKIIR
jgi:hypothetical protein